MPTTSIRPHAAPELTPLLPPGIPPATAVPDEVRQRFERCRSVLHDLGFDLEVRRDSLRVRHPSRGFERVIHLSGEDDLGEKRELFRALRSAFGSVVERWFPGLVQSSPTVTLPYLGLKQLVEICQAVRSLHRRPPVSDSTA